MVEQQHQQKKCINVFPIQKKEKKSTEKKRNLLLLLVVLGVVEHCKRSYALRSERLNNVVGNVGRNAWFDNRT
jgi:hypothetical protein